MAGVGVVAHGVARVQMCCRSRGRLGLSMFDPDMGIQIITTSVDAGTVWTGIGSRHVNKSVFPHLCKSHIFKNSE